MIYNAPVKDMVFLINEWIGLKHLTSLPDYDHLDVETLQFILEEAGKFCSTELLTINRQGDDHGARLADGAVSTPPGFIAAYRNFRENGWTGIDAEPEYGGQGLPKLVQFQVDEMMGACNLAFKLYAELSHGVYHLMLNNASEEIRNVYLPKLVEGVWSGTMCLTEPHSGSDLGLLNSRAKDNGDGTYDVTGTKIFITSGDHDLTDNIIHMVLARLEGAPPGPRGISLFLVPKIMLNEEGALGERNQVETGSIEHKMGIRGSATCVLNFDNARGYLVGQENKGLSAMFTMMNLERVTVGIQGLGFAEIAYQNALAYAKERLQSKAPAPRPDDSKPADPIIYHPEVQRQLLKIRSQVEGGRALAVYVGFQADVMEKSTDPQQKEGAADMMALLTPIVKSFLSDLGVSSTLSAQQMFGGHGYVAEHGMEQLVRDCRITQLYEGTNEIQALDLVNRKLTMKGGRLIERFLLQWTEFYSTQQGVDDSAGTTAPAREAFERLVVTTKWIREQLVRDDATARGAATNYQRLFALTTVACLWAEMMVAIRDKHGEFYDNKRKVARFYMGHVLPETSSLSQVIMESGQSLLDFSVEDFDKG